LPLHLPDVTVVCIDNVAQDLAIMALRDTLRQITPAQVLFWTDEAGSRKLLTAAILQGAPFEPETTVVRPFTEHGKEAADQPLWYEAPFEVRTSHYLTVQWDGWVIDAQAWTPTFLDYDFVGAPWWWHPPGQQVGNGGFSLRSRRLGAFLADNREAFPYRYPEDDAIGRHYRPRLEAEGFRFAPPELAYRFSIEHPSTDHRVRRVPTFGFHDIRNWGWVLSDEEIDTRLTAASAFVVKKTQLIEHMLRLRDQYRARPGAVATKPPT
jgi:hypothetical protein